MPTQLTLSQAAQLLKVSEKSIRRYIKSGRIKAVLVKGDRGNEYRINKDQLKSFDKPARGKNSHLSRGIAQRANSAKSRTISQGSKQSKKNKKAATKPIRKTQNTSQRKSDGDINIPIAPRMDSISEILEQKIQTNLGYLNIEQQRENNIDYKLLYERLLAKYEQVLIMIGSLEAQQSNTQKYQPETKKIEEMERDLARQEELIMGLYQDLRLYKQDNDISRY